MIPSNHFILCHSFLLLPLIFPSIRVFSKESTLRIKWPRYWSFSLSNSPSNEYSRLISFWIDWFDLLAAQGTLKSLLQHHSLKSSILQCSAFFMVQLSHLHATTGKTKSLNIRTFDTKVMALPFFFFLNLLLFFYFTILYWFCHTSTCIRHGCTHVPHLLFNTLSRFVLAFLPRSEYLNFMASVTIHSDSGAQEYKICHCFHFPPSICYEVMGPDTMIFVFWILSFKPAFSLSSFTLIEAL